MVDVERVLVNPAPGKVVLDMNGDQIIHKENGNKIPKIAFYNKLIRQGALNLVRVPAKKKTTTKEKKSTTSNK